MFTIFCFSLLFSTALSSSGSHKCIDGRYHKETASAEGSDYAECFSWKEKSCCTANFTIELSKNRVENLYNLSWSHCANLSKVGQHKSRTGDFYTAEWKYVGASLPGARKQYFLSINGGWIDEWVRCRLYGAHFSNSCCFVTAAGWI